MKKLIIIPLLFVSIIVSATNYYVASSDGNDGYNGLYDHYISGVDGPFKTISYGSDQLTIAGDTLFVRTGTYVETKIQIGSINGTALNPIVIMAFPGESPIIDGQDVYPTSDPLIMIWPTASYVYFSGFEIKNLSQGAYISNGSHNLISNCKIHDIKGSAIGIAGDYCTVEDIETYNVVMANYNHGVEYWGSGISARRSPNYTTIRRCIVHDCWGEGISTYEATHTTIEDNIIYDIYSVALYVSDATDCLVQRNLIYTTKDMYDGSQVGLGIWDEKNTPSSARNTFINNIVYGCRRNCYADQLDDVIIANNTFVNSTYFACMQITNVHSNTKIENNIIVQEDGLLCINYNGSGGITFSNNLYNKAYDADAVGADDEISVAHISKVGTYADTSYYRLVSESPAIDGGYDLSGTFTDDYEGTARGVTFDIGAIEYEPPDPPLDPILADVETFRPVWATATTATTGGNVIDDGGDPLGVTQKGVCWNTAGTPTIADSKTEEGAGTGTFTSTMTGLTKGVTYYVRAYATNSVGTAYGSQMSFRAVYFFHGGKILTHNGKILYID